MATLTSFGNDSLTPLKDGTAIKERNNTAKGTMKQLKKAGSFQKDLVDNEFQAFILFQLS